MKPPLLSLLLASLPLVSPGEEPQTIRVDVTVQPEFVRLAPAGDPPTFSALAILRVIDPATRKPYDRSNTVLGCDPEHLRRTFRLEAADVLLGEPVLLEFRIALDGPGEWDEPFGGNSRGLGRDGNFSFLMRHEDGTWVPDLYEGHDMTSFGGIGGTLRVTRAETHAHWLAVQQWCAIDRPGLYDLYAFHWGGTTRPAGLRLRVEAALTDAMNERVQVNEEGQLVDRKTGERPRDLFVEQTWNGTDGAEVGDSPVAAAIPDFVKAKLETAASASDFAHFRLRVRQGDAEQRQAMVRRWTTRVKADRDDPHADRADAVNVGMALARQDDFLPELKRRLRDGDRFGLGVVYLGLAMRDDPRARDMLFESGVPEAIEMMRFLRPAQVPAAIPRLIDRLTSDDHLTRAAAEEMLRRWTGQEIGHTWEGYHHERPTLEEGTAMQPRYRAWWQINQAGFQPRFR